MNVQKAEKVPISKRQSVLPMHLTEHNIRSQDDKWTLKIYYLRLRLLVKIGIGIYLKKKYIAVEEINDFPYDIILYLYMSLNNDELLWKNQFKHFYI